MSYGKERYFQHEPVHRPVQYRHLQDKGITMVYPRVVVFLFFYSVAHYFAASGC
jgi:hypothetical protein